MLYLTSSQIEIYDPLCDLFLPKYKFIRAFVNKHLLSKKMYILPQIQSLSSNICGYYVIFFALKKEQNCTFFKILKYFSRNKLKNDYTVLKFKNKM